MTKPCYEEPESELTRLRAEWYSPAQYSDLRQKAESARRDYEAAHKLWRDEEQKLARVRGLLQRQSELAGQIVYLAKGIYGREKILALANEIVGAESADIGKLDRVKKCHTLDLPEGFLGQRCGQCDSLFPHSNFKFCSECGAQLCYAME